MGLTRLFCHLPVPEQSTEALGCLLQRECVTISYFQVRKETHWSSAEWSEDTLTWDLNPSVSDSKSPRSDPHQVLLPFTLTVVQMQTCTVSSSCLAYSLSQVSDVGITLCCCYLRTFCWMRTGRSTSLAPGRQSMTGTDVFVTSSVIIIMIINILVYMFPTYI